MLSLFAEELAAEVHEPRPNDKSPILLDKLSLTALELLLIFALFSAPVLRRGLILTAPSLDLVDEFLKFLSC